MIARAAEGRRVCRLKGGDPFLFGRGGEEAEALRAAGYPLEVVAGVVLALAVPAYAGIPVTHRVRRARWRSARPRGGRRHREPVMGAARRPRPRRR